MDATFLEVLEGPLCYLSTARESVSKENFIKSLTVCMVSIVGE